MRSPQTPLFLFTAASQCDQERGARICGCHGESLDQFIAEAVADKMAEFDGADYPEAPTENYQAIYQAVGRHFPTFGYYDVPDFISQEIGESKIGVGDAIDDILDILLDPKGALWRINNTSVDDALRDLNQNFQHHWDLHLRELQLYLHVLASGVEESNTSTSA